MKNQQATTDLTARALLDTIADHAFRLEAVATNLRHKTSRGDYPALASLGQIECLMCQILEDRNERLFDRNVDQKPTLPDATIELAAKVAEATANECASDAQIARHGGDRELAATYAHDKRIATQIAEALGAGNLTYAANLFGLQDTAARERYSDVAEELGAKYTDAFNAFCHHG